MAEIINLRRMRKRAERGARAAEAEQNRVAHGLSKREKMQARAQADKARRGHDGKRLDKPEA
ncbi:MAG: DUF4169 family protein [Nitratireductor sp.]|nr:DUF4169 family protein [Nitratireductor sp.]